MVLNLSLFNQLCKLKKDGFIRKLLPYFYFKLLICRCRWWCFHQHHAYGLTIAVKFFYIKNTMGKWGTPAKAEC